MECCACGYQSDCKGDFFVSGVENPTYVCAWELEKACRDKVRVKEKLERARLQKVKDDAVNGHCEVSDEDLKKMSMEDQFECKYGLKFAGLVKNELQYRDACIRYTHSVTGGGFKYSNFGGLWSVI